MIQGFDYASVDGNKIDYTKVQASFVIIRGSYGYGTAAIPDSCLARDRALWQTKDVRVGAYMILSWNKALSPEDQANAFIRAYGKRRLGELPPSLDLEADSAASVGRSYQECLEWAERAYAVLMKFYGTVMIYTSMRVWSEVFGDKDSKMGASPLWLKVAYPMKTRQPHHPELAPIPKVAPDPWDANTSPGVWIVQYQGDAVGVPGFSTTVDCNYFCSRSSIDRMWLLQFLHDEEGQAIGVTELQTKLGLKGDGIIGPTTFAAMTQ